MENQPSLPVMLATEAEFAKRIGVSARTVQIWRKTGDGPAFVRIGPRQVRYALKDIETWEAQRTFPHLAAEVAAKKPVAKRAA